MPPSTQQFDGLREVLRYAPADDAHELRELLVQCALAMPTPPVADAAVEIAPHDLARALRLARLAPEDTVTKAVDDVYQAAARAAACGRAVELIADITSGRAAAYLDLADRTGATRDVLLLAERSLDTEPDGSRLVCQARLATLWWPIDRARGDRLATVVHAEATGLATQPESDEAVA